MLPRFSHGYHNPALDQLFQHMLGEPPARARALTRDWYRNRGRARNMWRHCAEAPADSIGERANRIALPGADALAQFLTRDSGTGLVLLTMHLGDYLYAIYRLLSLAPARDVVILRRKAGTDEEQACFAKLSSLGHNVATVRHSSRAAALLVGHLRRGAIAVLLFDLPARWGETREVTFLSQVMYWVEGPLILAAAGNARVIPFFAPRIEGVPHCLMMPTLDYSRGSGDLPSEHQQLCDAASHVVRQWPSQWHHWHLVPEMMAPSSHG